MSINANHSNDTFTPTTNTLTVGGGFAGKCDYTTPSTGFTYTIPSNVEKAFLNPSGTLATGTINLPATPVDGQEIIVASSQIITALTLAATQTLNASNQPTTLAAGSGFCYFYNLATTTWFRLF